MSESWEEAKRLVESKIEGMDGEALGKAINVVKSYLYDNFSTLSEEERKMCLDRWGELDKALRPIKLKLKKEGAKLLESNIEDMDEEDLKEAIDSINDYLDAHFYSLSDSEKQSLIRRCFDLDSALLDIEQANARKEWASSDEDSES